MVIAGASDLYGQGCPMGEKHNCVWGCGRFIDNNKDGFCDYSIVTVPEKNEAEKDQKKDSTASVKDSLSAKGRLDNQSSKSAKGIPDPDHQGNIQKTADSTGSANTAPADQEPQAQPSSDEDCTTLPLETGFNPKFFDPVYDLILVTSLTLGLYLITFILYKRKIIKRIHHRKFWNLMLLLTFIVSCLFGLFLVVQLNYNVAMNSFVTLRFWHVDIGISMALIAIIHILWHFTYFKNMVKKKW